MAAARSATPPRCPASRPISKTPRRSTTRVSTGRGYYHDKLAYRDVPLTAYSSSPVTSLELGQRFRTQVSFHNNTSGGRQKEYLVYEEHIPTGTLLVAGSLAGNYKRVETEGSKIRFYFAPGQLNQITYELVAHAPGKYRVLPGIVHDAVDRSRMRVGKSSAS